MNIPDEAIHKKLLEQIRLLKLENESLLSEIALLRSKVTFFDKVAWLEDGLRGEKAIAVMLNGELTRHNARHDITLQAQNLKLEIKLSNLNRPVKTASTLRWAWAHLLGVDSRKCYDRLFLLGEVDPRYREFYADPDSPYVIFDVPFADVPSLVDKFDLIHLTTNPRKAQTSTAMRLYHHYQVTPLLLRERYRSVS